MIAAKWLSFLRHVANKHKNHGNLYKECNHGNLRKRKWIKVGTVAHDKLDNLLSNKTLVNDIKNLSSDSQTSSLEGFHATLNHWHPKMICFFWLGTFCRHILASLHFNENVNREKQTNKNGDKYYKVSYPKFKLGEEVVRDVPCPPTYEYADELKNLMFNLPKNTLKETFDRYSAKAPDSLTSQFPNRASKDEAVTSHRERQNISTKLFPSAEEQDTLLKRTKQSQPASRSKAPSSTRASRNSKRAARGLSKGKRH